MLFHFFVSDIKDISLRDKFRANDSISYMAGGAFIENMTQKLLSNPYNISNKLTPDLFDRLLDQLFNETNTPYVRKLDTGKNKNDKRRKLKFFEKSLQFYYYKKRMPIYLLNNKFSIEHIAPNSSEWVGELDKDRTGNLIPIISTINSQRGNKHINSYRKTKEGKEFCEFIKPIIPNDDVYDSIIQHDRKPTIVNTEKYNEMCEKNEKIYKENLINCLFK